MESYQPRDKRECVLDVDTMGMVMEMISILVLIAACLIGIPMTRPLLSFSIYLCFLLPLFLSFHAIRKILYVLIFCNIDVN